MSSRAARALPLATALALLCSAACHAVSVDLGSDIQHQKPAATGGAGHHDAGGGAAGSGGSGSTANGSGGTSTVPVTPSDAGTSTRLDADVGPDADADGDAGVATDDASAPPLCPAGFEDCDDAPGNGCETDLHTDVMHCGSCATACPGFGFMSFGSTCVGGHCVLMCEAPHANCDGDPDNGCEADLNFGSSADENCGACGVKCNCNSGVCR